jgi:hypothetical protein
MLSRIFYINATSIIKKTYQFKEIQGSNLTEIDHKNLSLMTWILRYLKVNVTLISIYNIKQSQMFKIFSLLTEAYYVDLDYLVINVVVFWPQS